MNEYSKSHCIKVLTPNLVHRVSLDLCFELAQKSALRIDVRDNKSYRPCFVKTSSNSHWGKIVGLQIGDFVWDVDIPSRKIEMRSGYLLDYAHKIGRDLRYCYDGSSLDFLHEFFKAGFERVLQ